MAKVKEDQRRNSWPSQDHESAASDNDPRDNDQLIAEISSAHSQDSSSETDSSESNVPTKRGSIPKHFATDRPQLIRPMSLFLEDEYAKIENSVSLSWKNITYSVYGKTKKEDKKNILYDICGFVEPRKVLCILSPV